MFDKHTARIVEIVNELCDMELPHREDGIG